MKKSDQPDKPDKPNKPTAKSPTRAAAKKKPAAAASKQKAPAKATTAKPKSGAKPPKKATKAKKVAKTARSTKNKPDTTASAPPAVAETEIAEPIAPDAATEPGQPPQSSSASAEQPSTAQPVPAEPQLATQNAAPVSPFSRTVEIKIVMPSIPVPPRLRSGVVVLGHTTTATMLSAHLKAMPRRRLWLNFLVCLAVAVLLGSTHFFVPHAPAASGVAAAEHPTLQRGTPTYTTVLPAGKTISTLGGWARISPPDRDPVYAYIDKIGPTQINVSEQPLPKSFKAAPDQSINQLAQNFNATQKVTAGGATLYIGTSEQGAQSVIFTKNDLLILIKSADTLTTNDWVAYVTSLN